MDDSSTPTRGPGNETEYAWKDKSADKETRKYSNKLRDVYALAERLNGSFGQLAIAWSLKNKSVQCLLLGAYNIDQLYESLQSLQVTIKLCVSCERLFAPCYI
ncbi:voltage-gated potassium channel subunit beta-2-like [Temnothorax curvispinosus]|uniref:Voltage-gated potassium channel subunit beta-2-like n=1 Tax=Temnothorax curvispinosus TaxID=300111 RepID=A0A6J1PMH9_9HYME|nr:voltage-gated potassium channel subunit beta-2-like [Temnothorax curvispinosus]